MFRNINKDNIIYIFILFDLMVLPYFQIVIVPFSLLIVMFLFLGSKQKIHSDSDYRVFIIIALCAILSTAISPLYLSGDNYLSDNIKYLLQFISSFMYFFIFKWMSKTTEFNKSTVTIPIYLFFFWYMGLVIYYFSDPYGTVEFIRSLYGRTSVQVDDFENDLRFPYLFSDPNTAIYFFLLALSYLNFISPGLRNIMFLVIGGGLAALASQSSGGIAAYIALLLLTLAKELKVKASKVLIMLLSVLIFGFVVINSLVELDYFQELQKLSVDRLMDEGRFSSGGGRLFHWEHLLSLYPFPIGRGFTLYSEGIIIKPHSDLLGSIYRYGFLSTIALIYFLFYKDRRLTIFSIAIIIPFALNAVIEDQKIFGLYLALIGYSAGIRERSGDLFPIPPISKQVNGFAKKTSREAVI